MNVKVLCQRVGLMAVRAGRAALQHHALHSGNHRSQFVGKFLSRGIFADNYQDSIVVCRIAMLPEKLIDENPVLRKYCGTTSGFTVRR